MQRCCTPGVKQSSAKKLPKAVDQEVGMAFHTSEGTVETVIDSAQVRCREVQEHLNIALSALNTLSMELSSDETASSLQKVGPTSFTAEFVSHEMRIPCTHDRLLS